MNNYLTNSDKLQFQDKLQMKGIVPLESLINSYTNARVKMLELYRPDNKDLNDLNSKLIMNQSVLSFLNLLLMLNNTRTGKKALKELGIQIFTNQSTNDGIKKNIRS